MTKWIRPNSRGEGAFFDLGYLTFELCGAVLFLLSKSSIVDIAWAEEAVDLFRARRLTIYSDLGIACTPTFKYSSRQVPAAVPTQTEANRRNPKQ